MMVLINPAAFAYPAPPAQPPRITPFSTQSAGTRLSPQALFTPAQRPDARTVVHPMPEAVVGPVRALLRPAPPAPRALCQLSIKTRWKTLTRSVPTVQRRSGARCRSKPSLTLRVGPPLRPLHPLRVRCGGGACFIAKKRPQTRALNRRGMGMCGNVRGCLDAPAGSLATRPTWLAPAL